jgi:hypothetical protein
MLDKSDYELEKEVKEEIQANSTCYENNDLEVHRNFHCSKIIIN